MKRQRQNKLKTAVRLTVFITALTAVFTVNASAAGEDKLTLRLASALLKEMGETK